MLHSKQNFLLSKSWKVSNWKENVKVSENRHFKNEYHGLPKIEQLHNSYSLIVVTNITETKYFFIQIK